MKSCPYCEKKYPDEAMTCLIDGELLRDDKPQQELVISPDKKKPYLTFPDYQWSARDAWKCLGVFLVFELLIEMFLYALDWHYPSFRWWHERGIGFFSTKLLYFTIFLLTAAYFARTESFNVFLNAFGLDRKPSKYVWFGIGMALIIRLSGHLMITHGWGKGVSNPDTLGFKHTFGFDRYFFLLSPLLLAPVFEESVNRGFLYKAFRGSYSLGASMILIVAWTAFTHWPQYSHSWIAVFDLSALTIVQCYLREKSISLWDCILCHFAYNASSLLFLFATLR